MTPRLIVHLVKGRSLKSLFSSFTKDVLFPTCWLQYGECLDENQPPLDVSAKVKPLNNENVIKIEQDILTIEDCSRKCEESDLCEFYTLYGNDKNRNCQLVGLVYSIDTRQGTPNSQNFAKTNESVDYWSSA